MILAYGYFQLNLFHMFSKINAWLHLWLGIGSGLIVLIISITGAILVFESEITSMSSPWLHAAPVGNEPQMPPSAIYKSVHNAMPGKIIQSAWYNGPEKTVKVSIKDSDSLVFVNPYNAKIVATVDHEDFFPCQSTPPDRFFHSSKFLWGLYGCFSKNVAGVSQTRKSRSMKILSPLG